MKFSNFFFAQKTAFHIAVEKGNMEIITLLLNSEKIDVNITSI